MPTHRILSLDGGCCAITYLRCIREIELSRPGFLAAASSFAGVSDGAVASVGLALAEPGRRDAKDLEQAIRLADDVLRTMQPSLCEMIEFLSGCRALTDGTAVKKLITERFGASTRLDQLAAKVTIVSYGVKNPSDLTVYENYSPPGVGHAREKAVDVVMQSSAFPVVLPVYRAQIDGGLLANNVAAIAVALAASAGAPWAHDLSTVRCFSLGFGGARLGGRCVQAEWSAETANWGWGKWLLYLLDPLLFFQALFNSCDRGASYQCSKLLGPRFLRLDLPGPIGVISGVAANMLHRADELIERAEKTARGWRHGAGEPAVTPSFDEVLKWVDDVWLVD